MSETIIKEHEHVVADATHETPGAYDEAPTPKKAKKPRAPKARTIEEIIKRDNELSKLGIEIPIMIDLSLKLQFYDLLDDIYYDVEGMVNKLWK